MSRIGRAAARAVIGLYPTWWRHRYAAELRDLLADTDAGIGEALDLAAGAFNQHLSGGAHMRVETAHRHPSAFAIVASLIMAPTFAFVTLSLLGHELGVSAVASAVDPVIATVTAARIVDLALVVAPLIALVLAALPLLDARLEYGMGGRLLAIRLRALPGNLAVMGVALTLGAALVAHVVAESVLRAS